MPRYKDTILENNKLSSFLNICDTDFSTYFYPLKDQNKLTLVVRDYIAGMSDNYFSEIYEKYQKD